MELKSLTNTEFSVIRAKLLEVYENVITVFEKLDATKLESNLRDKQKQLMDDRFKIIIFGEMSRGKSTLINAVLGEKILPSRLTRCTAIPCNVRYSPNKHAMLHLRPPNEPERIDLIANPGALRDAISIPLGEASTDEDTDDLRRLHKYTEADIYVPLQICHNGVELQDSPGINEAPERTKETLQKLKDADAVVYLLSCMQPLTERESEEMRTVCGSRHTRDIFFVFNFVDQAWREPESEEEIKLDVEPRLKGIAGDDAKIFYISALEGLNAKLDGNKTLLERSGLGTLESSLQNYLMEYRFSSKLRAPLIAAEDAVNEGLLDLLLQRERLYRLPIENLQSQLEIVQPELTKAESTRSQMLSIFDSHIANTEHEVSLLIRQLGAFLENGVNAKLKEVDLNFWSAVAKRNDAKKRLARKIEIWILEKSEEWQEQTLDPFLRARVADLKDDITTYAVEIEQNLSEAQTALNNAAKLQDVAGESEVSGASRVLGTGLGILGGPGSMLEGASLGLESAARGLIPNVVAGVIMTAVLGLSGPVVVGVLAAIGVLRIAVGAQSYADKLRAKTANEVQTSIRDLMPEIEQQLLRAIRKQFRKERSRIDAIVRDDIRELTEQIESVLKERTQSEIEMEAGLERLSTQREVLHTQRTILSMLREYIERSTSADSISHRVEKSLDVKLKVLEESIIAAQTNRAASEAPLVEPKPGDSPNRTLDYYLEVLDKEASNQLRDVVNALERLGKNFGYTKLRIAELWSHFPSCDAPAEQDAYRVVCAMAVGEEIHGIQRNAVVTHWLQDQHLRNRLRYIAEAINPKEPLIFEEDITAETSDDVIPTKQDSYYARWRRGRDKAFPPKKVLPRAGTVVRSKDAPPPENRAN